MKDLTQPPTQSQFEARLQPGQQQLLQLTAGSEIRCLTGLLHLSGCADPASGLLPPGALHPHQAWRCPASAYLKLEAGADAARYRISLIDTQEEPPTQKSRSGWPLERLWRALLRLRPEQRAA